MKKGNLSKKLSLNKETLRGLERTEDLQAALGGSNPTAWTQCRACMTVESSCCTNPTYCC
jgi:hypothetical protein